MEGEESKRKRAFVNQSPLVQSHDNCEAFASLTDLEKSTLLLVYQRFTAKEIARKEGVTPDAINARLKRSRAKLGGISSAAAARLVYGQHEDSAYQSLVSHPLAVDPEPSLRP
jgi:DNA-binding CsgD family transcriptional regulator